MLRVLLIFALLCASGFVVAAEDPSQQFLNAYESFQQGESLERDGNTAEALSKYRYAESLLVAISKNDPSWQMPVIEYRLKKTREALERLQGQGSQDETVTSPPASGGSSAPDAAETSPSASDTPQQPLVPGVPRPDDAASSPSISISPPSSSAPSADTGDAFQRHAPASGVSAITRAEAKRLRELVDDLRSQLEEAHEALSNQKRRANDLESAEWVKTRSDLENRLDVANRKISDLEHDLKARASWGDDLKSLHKKLDDAVADKLVQEEDFQDQFKKISEQNSSLVQQLRDTKDRIVATASSRQKIEQLTDEVAKGREEVSALQSKLDHSEEVARDADAKNKAIQKELVETTAKLAAVRQQADQAAPLRDKIKSLEAQVGQDSAALRHQIDLEADNQVLEEDRDRLRQKVTALGQAAGEASKVKGLTEETQLLKQTVAQFQQRLDSADQELAKARTQAEATAKAAAQEKELQAKSLDDAEADNAVIQEERDRLAFKVDLASRRIASLQPEEDEAKSLKIQAEELKKRLSSSTEAMEQATIKLAQAKQTEADLSNAAQQKDHNARSLADLLMQQNNALQQQLKVALENLASSYSHDAESSSLQKQLGKLQAQMDSSARNYSESRQKLEELSRSGPEQAAILQQKEQALADAQAEASKLKSQLASAGEQIAAFKKQGDQGTSHLKELQDQLADRDATIAKLKNAKGNPTGDHLVEENTLLRGIVMREIKDEAKRSQVHRLMQEELKRLNVQSDTLQQQMDQLAAPAVQLTQQERSLFKDAQLEVSEQGNDTIEASIAAPMKRVADSNAATSLKSSTKGIDPTKALETPGDAASQAAKESATNSPAGDISPQGKFRQLLAQAKEEFDRHDYLEAEQTFLTSLKIFPNDYFALSNLGVVEFQLGKMKEAEDSLAKAADQSTNNSFALTTLGIVHYRQQRLSDAEKVLRKSVGIDPRDFTAHNYLGIVLASSGKGKDGESEIMKSLAINPNYADAHFNLAVIYATGKPPAKMMARKHYDKALELGSPPDPSLERLLQ